MKKFALLVFTLTCLGSASAQGLIELFYNALQNSSSDGTNPFAKNKDCTVDEFKYLNGGFFKAQEMGLDLKEGYKAIEVFNEKEHNMFLGRNFVGSSKRIFFITRRDGSPVGYSYEYHWTLMNRKYYLGLPILLSDKYEEKREVMKLFDESFKLFTTSNSSPNYLEPLLIVLMNPFSKEVGKLPEGNF
jgi:hypothetical protein